MTHHLGQTIRKGSQCSQLRLRFQRTSARASVSDVRVVGAGLMVDIFFSDGRWQWARFEGQTAGCMGSTAPHDLLAPSLAWNVTNHIFRGT